MILGRDILTHLGIDLSFSQYEIFWDGATMPMRNPEIFDQPLAEHLLAYKMIRECHTTMVKEDHLPQDRLNKILDAEYKATTVEEMIEAATPLSLTEMEQLRTLLERYKSLFYGTLGTLKGNPYDIELKPGVKPYHGQPFQAF